mmetsp:Transcript_16375/g.20248  ORF Transcript_16375/g.20248 Transcript_16375/m.20248 type:complete len:83 (-) Transcript_16375:124-372(-)
MNKSISYEDNDQISRIEFVETCKRLGMKDFILDHLEDLQGLVADKNCVIIYLPLFAENFVRVCGRGGLFTLIPKQHPIGELK